MSTPIPDVEHLEQVQAYVREHLAAAADAPPAFSPRWFALLADDPRRHSALVVAALARWAEDHELCAPVPRVLVETSHDVSRALRGASSIGPSHAELSARRDWHARAEVA